MLRSEASTVSVRCKYKYIFYFFYDNRLLATRFDKRVGFCLMRKQTIELKLESLLQSAQSLNEVILKFEKELDKELPAMNKREEVSDQIFSNRRSTRGQPARLYGSAKVHMTETTL